jgi:hypothetical protein
VLSARTPACQKVQNVFPPLFFVNNESLYNKLQKNKIPLGPPLLASNLAAVDKDGGRN